METRAQLSHGPRALTAAPSLWLLLAGSAVACSVPIASDLDDTQANRVVVALERASLDAIKEPDRSSEGKWRVEVARDDVAHALGILRDEGLPRAARQGVLEAVGKGALVPSEAAEHAQLVAATAADLERSLEQLDGVVSARVHLSLPEPGPLGEAAPPRGSASVLLEYRGSTPPLAVDSVQRLVSGAAAGLLPADVAVVPVSRTAAARAEAEEIGHVGPIAVARTSLRRLQAALAALIAIVALLAGATLVLSLRLARLRAEMATTGVDPKGPAA